MINPLAQELNESLKNTSAEKLFSDLGKRIYFPKGIIAQGGEAKQKAFTANGTIGTTVINGKAAILPSIQKYAPELSSRELVSYAPTAGFPEIRNAWKEKQIKKNPSLLNKTISLPVVVPGLTAGLSYIMDLFVDKDKPMLAPNPSWDNDVLIEKAVCSEAEKCGSVRIILNFPQNPSGYSPTSLEVQELSRILKQTAEKGTPILVISDDAYFGLNYEDDIEKESLFAHVCNLHENILAVKADGPTKEDFAWGFRCGFLTFGCKGFTEENYDALVKKLMGVIRSSVSCAATPSQSILLKSFNDENNDSEKEEFKQILKRRYKIVRNFVDTHSSDVIEALPFNSGYFMSFHTKNIDAESLRVKLLEEKGIGTISIDSSTLRVAFSSIDEDKIEQVYSAIYETAGELSRA